MSSKNDFLSGDELESLRKEIVTLAASEDRKADAGEEVAVVDELPPKALPIEDNGSYVRIDEDEMTAWLYLVSPAEERENYTMEELLSFLQSNGVMMGYHHSNLAAMIKKKVYDREILVAKGQPAVEGRDGYFEYKFDPDSYRAPKVLENGRVDYTNMSALSNVRKGDVVAVYHHDAATSRCMGFAL